MLYYFSVFLCRSKKQAHAASDYSPYNQPAPLEEYGKIADNGNILGEEEAGLNKESTHPDELKKTDNVLYLQLLSDYKNPSGGIVLKKIILGNNYSMKHIEITIFCLFILSVSFFATTVKSEMYSTIPDYTKYTNEQLTREYGQYSQDFDALQIEEKALQARVDSGERSDSLNTATEEFNVKARRINQINAVLPLEMKKRGLLSSTGKATGGARWDCPKEGEGLVPCGTENCPCKLCDFFVMFDRVMNFILFKIVPPLAVLMIAIGGFMLIFAYANPSGGGPEMVKKARSIFTAVVFGLLIIYCAWLIVNVFFQAIGVADWTGLKAGWWKINCQ